MPREDLHVQFRDLSNPRRQSFLVGSLDTLGLVRSCHMSLDFSRQYLIRFCILLLFRILSTWASCILCRYSRLARVVRFATFASFTMFRCFLIFLIFSCTSSISRGVTHTSLCRLQQRALPFFATPKIPLRLLRLHHPIWKIWHLGGTNCLGLLAYPRSLNLLYKVSLS